MRCDSFSASIDQDRNDFTLVSIAKIEYLNIYFIRMLYLWFKWLKLNFKMTSKIFHLNFVIFFDIQKY